MKRNRLIRQKFLELVRKLKETGIVEKLCKTKTPDAFNYIFSDYTDLIKALYRYYEYRRIFCI